ncbi:SPOR domain-containing protein [Terasakiella sp. A23]|uniref:SPOR domain-containing protein n=1 Tax=Terasakiella sp. FCG-A23 TaxID=3080561 RepID=UPI00295537B3|nr:SPOR domain-containing protein [Terasakiella sp. A23]MDV7338767.1 SPOR domain-containing protein [Terasakiella sp. A23]
MPHRDDFDDDLMDPSEDAFDYKPVSSDEGGGGKAIKLFLAVTVVAGLGGGAWYFVGGGPTDADNVPVVRAEVAPMKEKPSDPGGMDVPNRDKTVYNRVSGENTEPKLERLLPRPEKPMAKPEKGIALPPMPESGTGAAMSKELPPMPVVEKAPEIKEAAKPVEKVAPAPVLPAVPPAELAEKIEPPAPASIKDDNAPRALVKRSEQPAGPDKQDKDELVAKIAEALKEEPKQAEKPAEIANVTPPPAPKPTAKPAAPKAPAVKEAVKSGYVMQLLSSKSESGVKKTWDKIKSKNGDVVNGLSSNIVKANLGEKGIYYRLRLGPVATGDEAKKICNQLKKRNVGCFIVRVR